MSARWLKSQQMVVWDWMLLTSLVVMLYMIYTRRWSAPPTPPTPPTPERAVVSVVPDWRTSCTTVTLPTVIHQWPTLPNHMNADELMRYLQWSNTSSCVIYYDFSGKVVHRGEIAGVDGQKSVCIDPGVGPVTSACLFYTFSGNRPVIGFEFEQFVRQYGCRVHNFRAGVRAPGGSDDEFFHFETLKLGAATSAGDGTETLLSIYQRLTPAHGKRYVDVVAIEFEDGDEVEILTQIRHSGILARIRQLNIRVRLRQPDSVEYLRRLANTMRHIEDEGWSRFMSRPSLFDPGMVLGRADYLVYELAWYNNRLYKGFTKLYD